MPEYERYIKRIADSRKRYSREPFKSLHNPFLGTFDKSTYLDSLWKRMWYPQNPPLNSTGEQKKAYRDRLLAKAIEGDEIAQFTLLRAIDHPLYEATMTPRGPRLWAKGLNVNPEGKQYVHYYRYKVVLKGKPIGLNFYEDGIMLAKPKVKQIIDLKTGKVIYTRAPWRDKKQKQRKR